MIVAVAAQKGGVSKTREVDMAGAFAGSKGRRTAIEVEMSRDHLIENIQLDIEAGCDEIIIVVPNQRKIAT